MYSASSVGAGDVVMRQLQIQIHKISELVIIEALDGISSLGLGT